MKLRRFLLLCTLASNHDVTQNVLTLHLSNTAYTWMFRTDRL